MCHIIIDICDIFQLRTRRAQHIATTHSHPRAGPTGNVSAETIAVSTGIVSAETFVPGAETPANSPEALPRLQTPLVLKKVRVRPGSAENQISSVLLLGVAGRFKVREDRARGRESFQSLRRFRQCISRFSVRDSCVKGQALAHHELS